MDEQDLHKELFEEPEFVPEPEHHQKKLQRSANNSVLAGVCAGISEYFKIDVGTVRVSFLLSLLLGNWPVVVYLVIAFLLPVNRNELIQTNEEIEKQRKENFKTVLSGILMLLGLHFAFNQLGLRSTSSLLVLPNGFMFPVLAIAMGVFLLSNKISGLKTISLFPEKFILVKKKKLISGVCSGLARYLNVDLTSLRIVFIILSCLTLGIFSLAYIYIAVTAPLETPLYSNE